MQQSRIRVDDTRYLAIAARQLLSMIYIIASAGHFTPRTLALAAQHCVPMAGLLVPVSGVIALAGSATLGFAARTRAGWASDMAERITVRSRAAPPAPASPHGTGRSGSSLRPAESLARAR